jgi:hypothetical protein
MMMLSIFIELEYEEGITGDHLETAAWSTQDN